MLFAEVKAVLEQHKDMKELNDYLRGQYVNHDTVEQFLATDEGRKLIQPRLDQHFTKGLDTWRANNEDKVKAAAIDEYVAKNYPPETKEQKKLKEIESRLIESDKRAMRAELAKQALEYATQKGLPITLIDHFLGADWEGTKANLLKLEETWGPNVNQAAEKRIADTSGRKPATGAGTDNGTSAAKQFEDALGRKDFVSALSLARPKTN
jgi:hypothetical protein